MPVVKRANDIRKSGVCPVPIDWKFRTSSRHERSLMIEAAYQDQERRQREASEWQAHVWEYIHEKMAEQKGRAEKSRKTPSSNK